MNSKKNIDRHSRTRNDRIEPLEARSLLTDATIVASHVFYKGSFFAAQSVDAAIDSSKQLARPGATDTSTGMQNLLNTTLGINGIMIDVDQLASTSLTQSDFVFRQSPMGLFNQAVNLPNTWAAAPAPSGIFVTPGTPTTPARVRIEWANSVNIDRWIQIQMLNSPSTGLPVTEVFYIGNLRGEMNGQVIGSANFVTNADLTLVAPIGTTAAVNNPRDVDKNGFVLNSDGVAIRNSVNVGLNLRMLNVPASGSIGEGRVSSAPGVSGGTRFGELQNVRFVMQGTSRDNLTGLLTEASEDLL